MKSVLLQLYEGEICPGKQFIPRIEKSIHLRSEYFQHYDSFIEKLRNQTPPLDQQFIEIMDEQLDFLPLDNAQTFIDGFRLGARMMLEILQNPEQQP